MAEVPELKGENLKSQVDVETLKGVPAWVTEIRNFIAQKLIADVVKMKLGDGEITDIFGGSDRLKSPNIAAVGTKHNGYVDAVLGSLRKMDESLQNFSEGTDDIAAKYDSVEKRNTADVQEILRLLSGEGEQSGTGTPGPTGL